MPAEWKRALGRRIVNGKKESEDSKHKGEEKQSADREHMAWQCEANQGAWSWQKGPGAGSLVVPVRLACAAPASRCNCKAAALHLAATPEAQG
jgi:hypothetical protein